MSSVLFSLYMLGMAALWLATVGCIVLTLYYHQRQHAAEALQRDLEYDGPRCSFEGCSRPANYMIRQGVAVMAQGSDRAFCGRHVSHRP